MALIHYDKCPSCGSEKIQPALTAIDNTVSRKPFEILECSNCTLRFTQDIPDAASIGQYYRSDDYISHTDTNKGIINRLYHAVRKQTLAGKQRFIMSTTRMKAGRLLDIGAGTGAFTAHMRGQGWDVSGLEPDDVARGVAKANHGLDLQAVEELYNFPADHFDAITLWHVLEHVHDLHAYIGQLKKLIKRGGCIFIAVPNYTSYDAEFYKAAWAAYDVPRHLYHFSPASMRSLLESHNLLMNGSRPMWYDSFYISMLSEKYRTGHGNIIRATAIGTLSNMKAFVDKSRCSSLIYVAGK